MRSGYLFRRRFRAFRSRDPILFTNTSSGKPDLTLYDASICLFGRSLNLIRIRFIHDWNPRSSKWARMPHAFKQYKPNGYAFPNFPLLYIACSFPCIAIVHLLVPLLYPPLHLRYIPPATSHFCIVYRNLSTNRRKHPIVLI